MKEPEVSLRDLLALPLAMLGLALMGLAVGIGKSWTAWRMMEVFNIKNPKS